MRWRYLFVAALVAAAACDLNPQPLPPGDDSPNKAAGDPSDFGENSDASATTPIPGVDGGTGGDAAPPAPPEEGGVDGGSDAGDAAADAPDSG